MKTLDNLHNLHFKHHKKGWFFSEKWKNKEMYSRQISYDTADVQEAHFILIDNKLYLHLEEFGTKENPRILLLPYQSRKGLPEMYIKAMTYIFMCEGGILVMLAKLSIVELKKINTAKKLEAYFTNDIGLKPPFDELNALKG